MAADACVASLGGALRVVFDPALAKAIENQELDYPGDKIGDWLPDAVQQLMDLRQTVLDMRAPIEQARDSMVSENLLSIRLTGRPFPSYTAAAHGLCCELLAQVMNTFDRHDRNWSVL